MTDQIRKEHIFHKTRPIKVWVDVDVGIYETVLMLNRMKGIRTLASCQGTIGEGGPNEHPADVMITWKKWEDVKPLLKEFRYEALGKHFGYLWKRLTHQSL